MRNYFCRFIAPFDTYAAHDNSKKFEFYIAITVFLLVTTILTTFNYTQEYRNMGDTLIFREILDNIVAGKGPISDLFSSSQTIIDSGALAEGADKYKDISDKYDVDKPRSMMDFHFYLILYIMAGFVYFFRRLWSWLSSALAALLQ